MATLPANHFMRQNRVVDPLGRKGRAYLVKRVPNVLLFPGVPAGGA
jgi:hypothetical protein